MLRLTEMLTVIWKGEKDELNVNLPITWSF